MKKRILHIFVFLVVGLFLTWAINPAQEKSDSSKNWLVTDVSQNGPAWRAGLRKGYIVTGRSIHWGQTDKPVFLLFLNNHKEKIRVEYFPRGKKKTVPQYRLNEEFFQKNRAECLKWFGVTEIAHKYCR